MIYQYVCLCWGEGGGGGGGGGELLYLSCVIEQEATGAIHTCSWHHPERNTAGRPAQPAGRQDTACKNNNQLFNTSFRISHTLGIDAGLRCNIVHLPHKWVHL